MLATFAFDVCHDVYRAAREAIDEKIATLNAEGAGKYQWKPDRMPRLAEYVCDFALAGERALGVERALGMDANFSSGVRMDARNSVGGRAAEGAMRGLAARGQRLAVFCMGRARLPIVAAGCALRWRKADRLKPVLLFCRGGPAGRPCFGFIIWGERITTRRGGRWGSAN